MHSKRSRQPGSLSRHAALNPAIPPPRMATRARRRLTPAALARAQALASFARAERGPSRRPAQPAPAHRTARNNLLLRAIRTPPPLAVGLTRSLYEVQRREHPGHHTYARAGAVTRRRRSA